MKKAILSLLIMGATGCASHVTQRDAAHESALFLQMPGGTCSGTAIGPNAILSATHCFGDMFTLSVNGKPVEVLKRFDDGRDHTILIVDEEFNVWSRVGDKPRQGDKVFVYGNPGMFRDMYREGIVSGSVVLDGQRVTAYDLNGWFGDSGSAIFDQEGYIVGVTSIVLQQSREVTIKMMGSYSLNFEAKAWSEARARH